MMLCVEAAMLPCLIGTRLGRPVLPLVCRMSATSSGAGAEMRHAMGVAVFFGMLGVTLFGLFLTPVFYVLLRTLEKRITHTEKVHHHI